MKIVTPLSSTTSSSFSWRSAHSIVYSMPAQPPFFTPTRKPRTGRSLRFMISRTRSAAASVSVMTFGEGRRAGIGVSFVLLQHVQRHASFIRHARMIPGRLEHQIDLHAADTLDRGDGILHPSRHVARDRAARRGERHVNRHIAIFVDVDLVNEPELVDV